MNQNQTESKPTTPEQPTDEGLDETTCSASFDSWWNDQENGCPTLVLDNDEQFAHAVWNAAIKAADLAAWQNRDKWDEGDGYSPTKAAAAEEIGYSIRQLSVPNAPTQAPPTQNLTNQ